MCGCQDKHRFYFRIQELISGVGFMMYLSKNCADTYGVIPMAFGHLSVLVQASQKVGVF